jgi:hypothetical protein
MTETALLLKLVESIGFPGSFLQFGTCIIAPRSRPGKRAKHLRPRLQGANEAMNEHEARMFTLLNGQLEALQCCRASARMETKIDSTCFAPWSGRNPMHEKSEAKGRLAEYRRKRGELPWRERGVRAVAQCPRSLEPTWPPAHPRGPGQHDRLAAVTRSWTPDARIATLGGRPG